VKQKPNISVLKNEKLLNYVKQQILSDVVGNLTSGSNQDYTNDNMFHTNLTKYIKKSTLITTPKGKQKIKPNVNVIKNNFNDIKTHRIDMMKWANREFGINPDLLIETSTYYKLTITSYKILFSNETPTSKDFDIYCNGLMVDKNEYDIVVNDNIIITIQKHEAVDDNFDTNNFEIVSKFDGVLIGLGDINNDGEDDWLNTDDNKDILVE